MAHMVEQVECGSDTMLRVPLQLGSHDSPGVMRLLGWLGDKSKQIECAPTLCIGDAQVTI